MSDLGEAGRRLRRTPPWQPERPLNFRDYHFDPPSKVQIELRQRARLLLRLKEREDSWIPLPAGVFVLAALGRFYFQLNATVLAPLALVMVGGIPDLGRVSALKQASFAKSLSHAGFLRAVAEVFAWTFLVLAAGYFVEMSRLMLDDKRRRRAWQDAVWYELASNQPGAGAAYPAIHRFFGVAGRLPGMYWRVLLRRWPGTRTGQPRERLRHARRWARLDELDGVFQLFGYLLVGFVCVTVLLWRYHVVASAYPFFWAGAVWTSFVDYAWGFAGAVPLFEIPNTLGWQAPGPLAQDTLQKVLLLLFKLAIIAPVIAHVTHIFRDDTQFDPVADQPQVTDPLSALAEDLAAQRIPEDLGPRGWEASHARAAEILNRHGVPAPDPNGWTKLDIYRASR